MPAIGGMVIAFSDTWVIFAFGSLGFAIMFVVILILVAIFSYSTLKKLPAVVGVPAAVIVSGLAMLILGYFVGSAALALAGALFIALGGVAMFYLIKFGKMTSGAKGGVGNGYGSQTSELLRARRAANEAGITDRQMFQAMRNAR